MSTSTDVHRLLWQKLNEMYGNDANSMFVMAVGKHLNYADYSPTEFPKVAALNTFELVNSCIACNVNYSPTGSRISLQWEQLLYQGRGPKATEKQRPAFEKAKAMLYKNYETREPTELYKKYLEAKYAFEQKKVELKKECRQKYGDDWEANYYELLPATKEYQQFQALDREVSPQLQAIDEWVYGPLATVMAPFKEAFEENKRYVVLPDDGKERSYYRISMIPTNWFEWFDPDQPEDDSWINIIVGDQSTLDNENQSKLYKMLGGKPNAPLCFAVDQHIPHKMPGGKPNASSYFDVDQDIPHKIPGGKPNASSYFDVDQDIPHKMPGGKPNASSYFDVDQDIPHKMPGGNSFLQIWGENMQEKKVDIGDSKDVKIHLKVRSVQINRPWIDPSALKIQNWRIPGEIPGAWSTGVLDSSNNGSFPLLSTRMIVVRDITVTASSFSKKIINALKAFNPSVDSAVLLGLFSYTPSIRGYSKGSHDLRYDEKLNSIILTGTEVIGYGCTLLPKYPA